MAYYPVAIDLAGKKCLVVGGGEVARRKVQSLVDAGAEVTVISPEVDQGIEPIGGVRIERREFREGDASGCALVFACTDVAEVNAAVQRAALQEGALVNVVDDPELCSFIAPSVVRRGDLMIAIISSGKSPALSKRIRRELEAAYGPEYGELVDLMGEMRARVKEAYATQKEREAVFDRMLNVGILELLREGRCEEARERALGCI